MAISEMVKYRHSATFINSLGLRPNMRKQIELRGLEINEVEISNSKQRRLILYRAMVLVGSGSRHAKFGAKKHRH